MSEPKDLKDKLEDVKEIVFELIHDLSGNPVTPQEALCLRDLYDISRLVNSTSGRAQDLREDWPE